MGGGISLREWEHNNISKLLFGEVSCRFDGCKISLFTSLNDNCQYSSPQSHALIILPDLMYMKSYCY